MSKTGSRSAEPSLQNRGAGRVRLEGVPVITSEGVDIIFIHETIMTWLSKKSIEPLEERMSRLKWIIANGGSSDVKKATVERVNLRREINDFQWGFFLTSYKLRTTPILEKYSRLMKASRPVSFMKITNDRGARSEILRLKEEYLSVVKDYAIIEGSLPARASRSECDSCGGSEYTFCEDTGVIKCQCGVITEVYDDAPSYKDSDRVNMAKRYRYARGSYFTEAQDRFEAKQTKKISQEDLDVILMKMEFHGLSKETVTKEHLWNFMNSESLSKLYKHINLVYCIITGNPAPDISEYRKALTELQPFIEEAYEHVKDPSRKSSMNVDWKLYKCLQLLGYSCSRSDFYCLRTEAKKNEHNEVWKAMLAYLSNKYPTAKTPSGETLWRYVRNV